MKKTEDSAKPGSGLKARLYEGDPGFPRRKAKHEAPPETAIYGFRPLDKESYEPLYAQIPAQLREHIRSGRLGVNQLLPGEAELSRIFGVSRMTSRQALQQLTNDGFTYRERGRGIFVSPLKVEKQLAHLQGFSAEMRPLGLQAST
jgi:GntR family transcriptional regulator